MSYGISAADLDRLDTFLFSDAVPEEALDLVGIHGLLTAIAIAPVDIPREDWLETLFDGTPDYDSEQQREEIESLLDRIRSHIGKSLYSESEFELPYYDSEADDENSGDDLTLWCAAFMEGHFLAEEAWFAVDEETVAGLLLPIMVLSELFEDPEFDSMLDDPELCAELEAQIPEVVVDLYLLFRAPPESGSSKPGQSKGGKDHRSMH